MVDEPAKQGIGGTQKGPPEEHLGADGGADGENSARRESVPLKSGEALTAEEAFSITAASRTRLLVIAGAVGSGKTTLIASIFHRFQQEPFGGYIFAGSDTLIAFDERCYLARITSNRETAATKRTMPGIKRNLLHLRVREPSITQPARDLLFADLSGEDYEEFKDSPEECRRFAMIARADHFIVLVDGNKLIQPAARQGAKSDTAMLLQSCLDAEQLGCQSQVDIVISKWDLVDTATDRTVHIAYIEAMKKWFLQRFRPKLRRLRFFEIAARGERGHYEIACGLATPFKSWVEDLPAAVPTDCPLPERQELTTEFDRYVDRRFGGGHAEV